MREVPVTEAVGMVLCHDITKMSPAVKKTGPSGKGTSSGARIFPGSGTWEKNTSMSGSPYPT